jgi:hypothetical protein
VDSTVQCSTVQYNTGTQSSTVDTSVMWAESVMHCTSSANG